MSLILLLLLVCYCNEHYSYIITTSKQSSILKSNIFISSSSSSSSSNDAIINQQYGIMGLLNNFKKPSHIGVPRSKIDLQFAVQLMRASYNTVDYLDFVAMDEFQRTFFLFRQNEWEDYKGYHPNIMQGDLADPTYFDFISYAQYAVIADKMRNGKLEFVEKVNATGDTQIVRRNPMYIDNQLLPEFHSSLVGGIILDYIIETYSKNPQLLPPSPTPDMIISFDEFSKFGQLILDVFMINNYAFSMEITPLPSKTDETSSQLYQLIVKLPIILWGTQALMNRKDSPVNNFEIKVLKALAERYHLNLELLSTSITNKIDINYIVKLQRN